jgi:hypothetical protein
LSKGSVPEGPFIVRARLLLKLFAPVELDHTLICLATVSDDTVLTNCSLDTDVTAVVAAISIMTGAIPTAAAFGGEVVVAGVRGVFKFISLPHFLEDFVSHLEFVLFDLVLTAVPPIA